MVLVVEVVTTIVLLEVVTTTVLLVVLEPGTHAGQQLLLVPTVPPRAVHWSAERVTRQWKPLPCLGCRHVTAPSLPQVDLAAQRTILPRHSFGTRPRSALATQLT